MATPRELLALYGIEESQLESFFDDQPWSSDTDEPLARILHRLPQFGLDRIERWAARSGSWSDAWSQTDRYRGEFFRLEGQVQSVRAVTLTAELGELLELPQYSMVTLQLPQPDWTAVVCARRVPEAWLSAERLPCQASGYGLLLKRGPAGESPRQLFFAADRLAWHPRQEERQRGAAPELLALGSLGVDAGRFDDLRRTNGQPLVDSDRECFYQLLAATGQRQAGSLWTTSAQPLDLARLLRDPSSHQPSFVTFEADARRVTRIEVGDKDIRQRFGIDHYFEIDLFVDLDDRTVQFRNEPSQEPLVFTNRYPVTVCALTVPAALAPSPPQAAGTNPPQLLNQRLHVTGVFLKLWSYRSQYASQLGPERRQISPLIVALTPQPIASTPGQSHWLGLATGLAFVAGLAMLAWVEFRERARRQERRARLGR